MSKQYYTVSAQEAPPAYDEATRTHSIQTISEEEFSMKQSSKHAKTPSEMPTWKSILTGDVHKHNPRLRDPMSLDPRYACAYALEQEAKAERKAAKKSSKQSSKKSTIKSILTGSHRPMYRLDESLQAYMVHKG